MGAVRDWFSDQGNSIGNTFTTDDYTWNDFGDTVDSLGEQSTWNSAYDTITDYETALDIATNQIERTLTLAEQNGITMDTAGGTLMEGFGKSLDTLQMVNNQTNDIYEQMITDGGADAITQEAWAMGQDGLGDTETMVKDWLNDNRMDIRDLDIPNVDGNTVTGLKESGWTSAADVYGQLFEKSTQAVNDLSQRTASMVTSSVSQNALHAAEGTSYDSQTDNGGNYDFVLSYADYKTIQAGDNGSYMQVFGDNAQISGGAGQDQIHAYGANTGIYSGAGNDDINAVGGGNAVHSGVGHDTVLVSGADNLVHSGDGNDDVIVIGNTSQVFAGSGNDVLTAYGNYNSLSGEAGNDSIAMSGHGNVARGGDGHDAIGAVGDGQAAYGDAGNDVIHIVGDNNYASGGTGNDHLTVDGQGNVALGGDGDDVLIAQGEYNSIKGDGGDDVIFVEGNNNQLHGGAGNDAIILEGGNSSVFAGDGNDVIGAVGSGNFVDGGDGDDTVNVSGTYVTATGGTGNDTIHVDGSNNQLHGGSGDDTMTLSGGNSSLFAGDGNDVLVSNGAGNYLFGGTGNDVLVGGEGSETYVFNLGDGSDAIADLGGSDILQINGNPADWGELEIQATKGDDGSFLNLMFSEGDTQWGDVTIDLTHGELLETLKLGDGSELNIQDIYDSALEVTTADIDGMSASLEAVLDGADGISETGEIVDEVFVETDGGANSDPLTDDIIG